MLHTFTVSYAWRKLGHILNGNLLNMRRKHGKRLYDNLSFVNNMNELMCAARLPILTHCQLAIILNVWISKQLFDITLELMPEYLVTGKPVS